MRLVLCHGWNVRTGRDSSLRKLGHALRALDYHVIEPSYGRVLTPWTTRFRSRTAAKLLAPALLPGDVLIGHSNGARVTWEASYYSHPCSRMIWLQPALDSHVVPDFSVKECAVFWNRHDNAVKWAKLVPLSNWGEMGRTGYRPEDGWPFGPDRRMTNIEMGAGHSPWQDDPWPWAHRIDRWLQG